MEKKKKSEEHGLPSLSLVFGYIATKELQRKEDRVDVLSRLGYGDAEIATICDTSPNSVRALKSKRRQKRTGRGR
jgi:DNA-binding CsgD family transcriptional regulator